MQAASPQLHGDPRAYWRGCRCRPCAVAAAAYYAARRREGRPRFVPPEPVRAHLRQFRGLGSRQIAKLAGVSRFVVIAIQAGDQTFIRAETADRLLTIDPVRAGGCLVSAWRTRKLLRALEAEGWTRAQIAERIGLTGERALQCVRPRVRLETQRRVEALYRSVMRDEWDGTVLR